MTEPSSTTTSAVSDLKSSAVTSKIQESKNKGTYGYISPLPNIEAFDGIKYDFNFGCRVMFPINSPDYELIVKDIDKNFVIYKNTVHPGDGGSVITMIKKFFINYRIEIRKPDTHELVFEHNYNAEGKRVLIQYPENTLGDTIAWFAAAEAFQKKHKCELYVSISKHLADMFRDQYPNINFVTKDTVKGIDPYASYYMGLFFKHDSDWQPIDYRLAGLHEQASNILGLPKSEEPPRVNLSHPRQIKEKYVCIAAQSSAQCKYWNNSTGWIEVIKFLKDNGYRVLCIDKELSYGNHVVQNRIPWGSEDFTGNRPLQERIDLIKDADFFIGLGSGLSWVAWCCKVPVVLISGFSTPYTEFYTPYRVINTQTCNSCWNDMSVDFDHANYMWCPRHQTDNRQFECTRNITGTQVINVIKTIPTFVAKETD